MIEIDGEIDFYEYCFYRILMSNLGLAIDPSGRRTAIRARKKELRLASDRPAASTCQLMEMNLSEQSNAAFRAGRAMLGAWAQDHDYQSEQRVTVAVLDHSLDVLLGLNSKGKGDLCCERSAPRRRTMRRLSIGEAELIRAVCATLDYPLPPILVRRTSG